MLQRTRVWLVLWDISVEKIFEKKNWSFSKLSSLDSKKKKQYNSYFKNYNKYLIKYTNRATESTEPAAGWIFSSKNRKKKGTQQFKKTQKVPKKYVPIVSVNRINK